MPQAVTHVIIAIVLFDLYRDYCLPDRKRFPLNLVLLGGIAGLLPDLDIPAYWFVHNLLGFDVPMFHRGITHSVFFPLLFLLLAFVMHYWRPRDHLHKSKQWSTIFGIISIGVTIHILLDMFVSGAVSPFYPFWDWTYNSGIFSGITLPSFWQGLDAVILLAWLYHQERKHKIRDFI